MKVKSLLTSILLSILLLLIINISLLFRGTLGFFHFVFLLAAIIFFLKKNLSNKTAFRFLLTFIIFYLSFNYVSPFQFFPVSENKSSNGFVFFGHTLYGGSGGEGAFIYKENLVKYKKELALYLIEKKIKEPTISDTNDFHRREIARFIKYEPLKWFSLQIKKILYTYGIVPIKDNLTILMTGHIKFGLLLSLFLSQITFVIPIVLLFVFFRWDRFKKILSDEKGMMLILVTVYLMLATTIYGHYQERYRIVVMVSALIPLSALFLDLNYFKNIFQDKRILLLKILALLLLFSFWGYQVYEALVLHGTRYMNAIHSIHNMKN
jgi:hypothetical protein